MFRHRLGALVCAGIAAQLLASTAQAATFTATVNPSAPGTTQSPRAHTTALSLSKIDPGLDGNAKAAITTLVDSLPADFAATLSHYSSCSASVVVHGDNKPNCPAGSVLGTVSATAYVPALAFSTMSDHGYIYKIDNNTMRVWVHVSNPIPAGVVVQGTLSQGVAPFGPVVTWDFTPLANGSQTGSEVRVNRVDFSWEQAGTASPTPGPSRRCKAASKRSKRKHRRSTHCIKRKRKPTTTTAQYAPFVSSGCSTGKWPFEAQITFADNTKETDDTSVGCTPG